MRISDWSSDVCSSDLSKPQSFSRTGRDHPVGPVPAAGLASAAPFGNRGGGSAAGWDGVPALDRCSRIVTGRGDPDSRWHDRPDGGVVHGEEGRQGGPAFRGLGPSAGTSRAPGSATLAPLAAWTGRV